MIKGNKEDHKGFEKGNENDGLLALLNSVVCSMHRHLLYLIVGWRALKRAEF